MNQKYYLLAILLLLIAMTVMYFERPSGHFQQVEALKQEREALLKIIERKDVLIKESSLREIAFKTQLQASEATRKKDSTFAYETIKWFKNERKRKTGILATDTAYTLAIDSLFTR